MRLEDIRPEAREKVRKLRSKLCELAVEYKGVKPEACQNCESPCEYGTQILVVLGMDRPLRETGRRQGFAQDRRMRKIIRGMNRRWRK